MSIQIKLVLDKIKH